MATQILLLHWKAVRLGLVPFVVAAFALPLISVQGLGGSAPGLDAYRVVDSFHLWLPLYPALAAGIGITLALSAWNWDHQGDHVYALSLPVARWEYALLKMGAGVVLALIPVAAMLGGSLVATASVDLPSGLHAYPVAVTVRFLLATLLAYAAMFAFAAGTIRTAVIALTVLVAFPIVGGFVFDFLANIYPALAPVSFGEVIYQGLFDLPGPFEVFTGSWMLIDV